MKTGSPMFGQRVVDLEIEERVHALGFRTHSIAPDSAEGFDRSTMAVGAEIASSSGAWSRILAVAADGGHVGLFEDADGVWRFEAEEWLLDSAKNARVVCSSLASLVITRKGIGSFVFFAKGQNFFSLNLE